MLIVEEVVMSRALEGTAGFDVLFKIILIIVNKYLFFCEIFIAFAYIQ